MALLLSACVGGSNASTDAAAETDATGRVDSASNDGSLEARDAKQDALEDSALPDAKRESLPIEVICRDAWGAQAAKDGMIAHTHVQLTLHHTAVALDDNTKAPARLRSHQNYHQNTQGWPDLAYHFAVDLNGNVYQGRDYDYAGDTGTEYDPTGHFLVVVEGDYQTQMPTEAQLASVARMFAWASEAFKIAPETLGGHRDYAETTCPGDHLASMLATVESRVLEIRKTNTVSLTLICGSEGDAAITKIERGER